MIHHDRITELLSDPQFIMGALREAAAVAIREHELYNLPMAIDDGSGPRWVMPGEIPMILEALRLRSQIPK